MGIIFKSLLKHWRGEYGLGRSFWLHGILTLIVSIIIIIIASKYISPLLKIEIIVQIFLILSTLSIIATTTISVGIFRSALKHSVKWHRRLVYFFIIIAWFFCIKKILAFMILLLKILIDIF